jgi:hypothetical protein
MMHLSGNVVSLKAFVPDISDQTAYAVAKAMARYPDDRYDSYAEFISQLEDAKRRITHPNYRDTQKNEVEILEEPGGSKYKLWLIIGMVVFVFAMIGLFVWKGSALLHQQQAPGADTSDLNDYNPKAPPPKPTVPVKNH